MAKKGRFEKQYSVITLVWFSAFFGGCAAVDESLMNLPQEPSPVTEGQWVRPALQSRWHWQLSGALNIDYAVDLYDVDLFDTPSATIDELQLRGVTVICYFSAGSYENWRDDIADIPAQAIGNTLEGWSDERWWDIRSAPVQRVMQTRLDLAVSKGCDGVEPDNVDGYINNSGFALSADDQLAFNRFLANEAHQRNLAVGLKNDLDQIEALVDYFDFAVNEQCFEYDECETLTPFISAGKPVFNAEYRATWVNDQAARQSLCAQANERQFSSLVLPLELDDSFRFSCND